MRRHFRVGGAAELVTPGTHGWLIAAGDRAALVARTVALLADPARLAAMRIAARRRAETFSLEAMVDATEAAFRSLAGRGFVELEPSPMTAGREETAQNPRARSAKLRVLARREAA